MDAHLGDRKSTNGHQTTSLTYESDTGTNRLKLQLCKTGRHERDTTSSKTDLHRQVKNRSLGLYRTVQSFTHKVNIHISAQVVINTDSISIKLFVELIPVLAAEDGFRLV